MWNSRLLLVWALLVLLVAPLAGAAEHVILVSIDGLAAYHLYNEQLVLPNIRALIRQGVWAASSETVFPSVTHPSHTTMVTGVPPKEHGVLSNDMHNRETGERFHPTNKNRLEIVKVPTLFDAAKRKGMKTAAFFWPETRDDPSIDFNVPEVFTPNRGAEIRTTDPKIIEELRAAGVRADLYFEWFHGPRQGVGDLVLAEAAAYVFGRYKPGLLALHMLVTDQTQHEYGPHHYLSSAALTQADQGVGILRAAVEKAGLGDRTVFVIAADHGFHSVYHEANVRPVFEKAGLLDRIEVTGTGWALWLRLKDNFDKVRDLPRLTKVFDELLAFDHVARVLGPEEIEELGQPRFEEDVHAMGHYAIIPDIDTHLIFDADDASMKRRLKAKPAHSHGYLPQHPRMYPALVLSGAGVRKGVTIGHQHNLDIAPTICELLGLEMSGLKGQVNRVGLEK